MKTDKRVFNFNLPNDLREYLKLKSEKEKTTISHYIINLILVDKSKQKDEIFYEVKSRVLEKLKNTDIKIITEEQINNICREEIQKMKENL